MHHEDNCAGQDTEDSGHGDGNAHDWQQGGGGIRGNIRTGTAVPPTVLVTAMDTGALIVQGRPDGPRVYLTPGEAVALRRELATAFRSAKRGRRDSQSGPR